MSSAFHPVDGRQIAPSFAELRQYKLSATQLLLGHTIAITDDQWQQPSRLPGWTRAHVASHLARNADAMRRLVRSLLLHGPAQLYPPELDRMEQIEEGSHRSALDLQIDMDTSAGLLHESFNQLEESGDDRPLRLSDTVEIGAQLLPLARLGEVVVHHVDLDCGYDMYDIDGDIATLLLQWTVLTAAGSWPHQAVSMTASSGFTGTLGEGEPTEVTGTDQALLGWLVGRLPADTVIGAQGLELPLR